MDSPQNQSLQEENKDNVEQVVERKTVDHSLANVVAFSTKTMQFSGDSKEGLLCSDKDSDNDRRIKIDYDSKEHDLRSFKSASQLVAFLPNGKQAVGSCTHIVLNTKNYIMTCAHNVTTLSSFRDCFVNHTDGRVYGARFGKNKWRKLFEVDMENIKVHPNYDGDPACGFDFAVAPVKIIDHPHSGKVSESKVRDSTCTFVNPRSVKVGMKIELCGYPGEKGGYPYYSQGIIKGIKRKKQDGIVLYYDMDSTPGMSGSQIMMVDEEWIKDNVRLTEDKGIKKFVIGIHTGHDNTVMLNFGTLCTLSLFHWMNGTAEETKVSDMETTSNGAALLRKVSDIGTTDYCSVS